MPSKSYRLSLLRFVWNFYCPQTKFAKVMFLHLSVSHSVHRGVCLSACWDTARPPDHAPPPGPDTCLSVILFKGGVCLSACWDTTPPGPGTPSPREQRRLLLRTVRILLECILVTIFFLLQILHWMFTHIEIENCDTMTMSLFSRYILLDAMCLAAEKYVCAHQT